MGMGMWVERRLSTVKLLGVLVGLWLSDIGMALLQGWGRGSFGSLTGLDI